MRRKERVKSEEGAGSPGKVSRAHSRKKKRREATTEAGVGDADENPAGSLEKAGASLEVDEGRWIPDESHAIAGQAGGFPVASSSEVEGRATAGAALLSVKSRCQEVEAVRTAGDASATGTPTNVDKHLLDLRRAVEQSFKRRRRKSLQADVEMKDDT